MPRCRASEFFCKICPEVIPWFGGSAMNNSTQIVINSLFQEISKCNHSNEKKALTTFETYFLPAGDTNGVEGCLCSTHERYSYIFRTIPMIFLVPREYFDIQELIP